MSRFFKGYLYSSIDIIFSQIHNFIIEVKIKQVSIIGGVVFDIFYILLLWAENYPPPLYKNKFLDDKHILSIDAISLHRLV